MLSVCYLWWESLTPPDETPIHHRWIPSVSRYPLQLSELRQCRWSVLSKDTTQGVVTRWGRGSNYNIEVSSTLMTTEPCAFEIKTNKFGTILLHLWANFKTALKESQKPQTNRNHIRIDWLLIAECWYDLM